MSRIKNHKCSEIEKYQTTTELLEYKNQINKI